MPSISDYRSGSSDDFRRLRPTNSQQTLVRFLLLLALGPALLFLLLSLVKTENVFWVGEILKPMTFPIVLAVFLLPLRLSLLLCLAIPLLCWCLSLVILGQGIPPMNWMHGYRLVVENCLTVLAIFIAHRYLGMSWWMAIILGAFLNRSIAVFLAAAALLGNDPTTVTFNMTSVVLGFIGFSFPLATIAMLRSRMLRSDLPMQNHDTPALL